MAVSEHWASKRRSAAEHVSVASRAEQANEWEVQANKRRDEQAAQYSLRLFHNDSVHCAVCNDVTQIDIKVTVGEGENKIDTQEMDLSNQPH